MKTVIMSMITGIIVGIIFTMLKFPIPAPPTIEAFMGIFGVWAGAAIVDRLSK
ncbi:XapX domain-containing protein [Alkalithermobacter thermoalcaliphilus JW-YL-7 = DSM 7308]|uniref:XapX domain-containing protein n=1 Tax=Alkalithermobacter thermoalcaliphilus JW-YL-7 = DSM 7308 TaxID=1121328 RepID=A0A150FPE3_CLOPD|nr:XapX domain containing protein [[Clostridium] paradoxum JW-YL-7 = DSM 7308]SHL30762.1 XapX domain-containing protein [[Clostridium] paradoxum JW-YL-7 = DSM 7308]